MSEFLIQVKENAFKNDSVQSEFEAPEAIRSFRDRDEAERFAQWLTSKGSVRVVIQGAAPQDDSCDAYLVALPKRSVREPMEPDEEYWRFHTEANMYGAIGETLVTTPNRNPPALRYYIERDLNRSYDDLNVYVETSPPSVRGWTPDCRVIAENGFMGPVIKEYWCEIKTGDASFQRNQRAGMDKKVQESEVLKVRVQIDELPDEYSVNIQPYSP